MDSTQIVILSLEENEFGIRMDNVSAIERPPELCKFPGLPPYIEGLAEIRGEVYTVVNLRKKLGFSGKEIDEETRLILLEACSSLIGLMADSVREITTVGSKDAMENADAAGQPSAKPRNKYVKDMVNIQGRIIPLLEPERLLLDD